jgi:hypothetical protein
VPDTDMPRPRAYGAGRTVGICFRCRPEWRDWLTRTRQEIGAGEAELIEWALREWAQARGLPGPPQR